MNGLFGNLKLAKTSDTLKFKCHGGIGVFFDSRCEYSNSKFTNARNLILLRTDTTDNIYTIGHSFTQGLQYGKIIYAKSDYKIVNPREQDKKIVLSLHYNGDNLYLFVNGIKQIQFTASDQSAFKGLLAIGNVTKDFSITYQKRTGRHGDIYDFAVDYVPTDTSKIYDISKDLILILSTIADLESCYQIQRIACH